MGFIKCAKLLPNFHILSFMWYIFKETKLRWVDLLMKLPYCTSKPHTNLKYITMDNPPSPSIYCFHIYYKPVQIFMYSVMSVSYTEDVQHGLQKCSAHWWAIIQSLECWWIMKEVLGILYQKTPCRTLVYQFVAILKSLVYLQHGVYTKCILDYKSFLYYQTCCTVWIFLIYIYIIYM